jgi:hypothetical protein
MRASWVQEAREDLAWRDEAHSRGRSTNLDEIPALFLYVIHLLWNLVGLRGGGRSDMSLSPRADSRQSGGGGVNGQAALERDLGYRRR